MKNLLLITNGFPYGEKEHSFLYLEFMELCKHFHVTILAINSSTQEIKYPIPNTVPVLKAFSNKKGENNKRNIFMLVWQMHKREVHHEMMAVLKKSKSIKKAVVRMLKILSYSYYADKYSKTIKKIVLDNSIDCIYTYWCTQATLAAINIKNDKGRNKKRDLKVITRFHGFDLYNERLAGNWQCYREYIAKYADRLVFACETGKRYFQQHWNVDEKKLVVSILGSRDFGVFFPYCNGPREEISIVSCSNLVPLKKVDLIVRGISLLEDNIKVSWTHIGSGEARQEIEDLCKELLDDKKNIKWSLKGYIENDQIQQIYQNVEAQIFITTSSSEGGIPVSIQEAFSMGIPAIGTAVGGISEIIIDNENGFLLSGNPTPDEVATKIREFNNLSNENKRKMRSEARAKWEHEGDASKNAEKFVNLLVGLI